MDARSLAFSDAYLDVMLNRHAPTEVAEIVRVLRPGGVFVTQQVGCRNTKNICAIFEFDPTVKWPGDFRHVHPRARAFRETGSEVVALGEYDAGYRLLDAESFVFWFKAVSIPSDVEHDWRKALEVIDRYGGPDGTETNEHHALLTVRKR